MNPDPTPATSYAPGVTLLTKDGTRIGNAIVVKRDGQTRRINKPLDDEVVIIPVWLIETDFGNRTSLSEQELNTMFTLGFVGDYDEWWDERLSAIHKAVAEYYPKRSR